MNDVAAPAPRALYEKAETLQEIQTNLGDIQARIQAACTRVGRNQSEVRLLPVSKTVDEARIRMAYQAGCRLLGENKVQEAYGKWETLSDLGDLQWAIIGHLQTNKAKFVARFAHEFQALDNLRVAEALDRHLQAEGRSLDVFVQVNTSHEDSKFGLQPADVLAFAKALPGYGALRVRGLMTLALFATDQAQVRPCFVRLRELRDMLRQDAPQGAAFAELSMGMSGDFEWAIEEGATTVRVGQAIFGSRKLPDSYYWPEGHKA
ncbi:MAG: YggS family pyridoxal phosphate-dependent enzyme [Castellaniella sp.]|uniref:YggS family pyridoxal phosphate-dependent enzyme n=1 Tax=Castellaniella sp. TaxID=1955812 RepID=UPI001228E5DF|nr:YggS family pyridoxal phosphate-dependent enzyme [Castellaniella sp.]TAN26683.1 MAG: YggS family pyridoxal phosphate-dependent enzyme [Castellaniella sp.]